MFCPGTPMLTPALMLTPVTHPRAGASSAPVLSGPLQQPPRTQTPNLRVYRINAFPPWRQRNRASCFSAMPCLSLHCILKSCLSPPPKQSACVSAKSIQWCPTLCNRMDCSPPGSSVHEILQARLLEWVAMPSSREYSWLKDRTSISFDSCIDRWILYH